MRVILSICLYLLLICSSTPVFAQDLSDNGIQFNPSLRSVWGEVIILPIPWWFAAGVGVDYDVFRDHYPDSLHIGNTFGLRAELSYGGTGDSYFYFYTDLDFLARWSLSSRRFSLALMTGYAYRDWSEPWYKDYSGNRWKFGIELNYIIYYPNISLRAKVMGAGFDSFGDIEWGPTNVGIAVGWLDLR